MIPNDILEQKISAHLPQEGVAKILARRAQSLARSAGRFIRHGAPPTPPEVLAEREATCRACDQWDAAALNGTGRCRKCGCSTWAKLRMATESCPLGKWKAVSAAPEVARKPE